MVYLIIFATYLAYFLYFYGLNRVSIAAGCSLFYLKPVMASILSVVLLKETLTTNFFLGLIIIFTGLGLTTFSDIFNKEAFPAKKESP